ncbi:MAG: ATP-grasp domain-containing protein [Gaiellales bacterium]
MRIAFVLVRRPPGSIWPEVMRLVAQRGIEVDVIYPDEQPIDLANLKLEHDLYVMKSGSETALSLAGALHALGATILNPYPVAVMCRDKIVASEVLERAGVPVPESYVVAQPAHLEPLLDDGALVVKPYRGSQGRGIQVVKDEHDLSKVHTNGPLLAQRYHPPDGPDRKIYCIGREVFGVERIWPARTYREKLGRPFRVNKEIREIAFRCGAAFGISLFGFDVVMSEGVPYVVDNSSFPGFKGVPNAASKLADYIDTAKNLVARGEHLLPGLLGGEWARA